MPRSQLKPKQIYGWDGFELSSDKISLGLTPSIGGRLMSLIYQGHELLFVDPQHQGETFDPSQWNNLSKMKKELSFRVWGGDKTWVAPQKDWLSDIPPLDLDAAPYQLSWENEEVVMSSGFCRETGLQIVRRIRIEAQQVILIEELYNRTDKPLQRGLWNVTQLKRPCFFEIPIEPGAFRSYHLEDKTLPAYPHSLSPMNGRLIINCSNHDLFKLGGFPKKGEVIIKVPSPKGEITWKKSFLLEPKAMYAHDSVIEVFNSPDYAYAEIEIHAPLKTLAPAECIRLEQRWEING